MATRKKLSLDEEVAYCLGGDIDSCGGGLTADEELEINSERRIIIIVLQINGKLSFMTFFFAFVNLELVVYLTAFTLSFKMKCNVIE